MQRKNILLVIMMLSFIISGCATQRGWRYSAESKKHREPLINKTVAVPPFKDAREEKSNNALMLSWIPIMPFGWCDYSAPEAGGMKLNSAPIWLFKPTEDLAKAAAEELEASGLFKEVFYTQRASEGDLVFLGTINSTMYQGTMITYGLSFYGSYLWLLGFPCGSIHNELAVEFSLVDRNNAVLWSNDYKLNYDKSAMWIYSLPSDFQYDSLYKDIMLETVMDLEGKLK